jgi:4-alpha-glucanotransferase
MRDRTAHPDPFIRERAAGILLHITSLPSSFGIGDVGPEAYAFVDFLKRSGQKYWQLLPLNPTTVNAGHSPYSSISSMAGNTVLISVDLLARDGLLDKRSLRQYIIPNTGKVAFEEAAHIKQDLLKDAHATFLGGNFTIGKKLFEMFCEQQAFWLDDYALYVVLKQHHKGGAWFQWPAEFKLRKEKALVSFSNNNADTITYIKWLQFVFATQWHELKLYCRRAGIKLFGDLPFYVSHDSADVWSHPEFFSLDKKGNLAGVAGVPPDYFNKNGQRWGMPVFRWDVLKQQRYAWWMQRLRKNMELFDLLRLDHFRAFSDYWEVPAKSKTAINGKWKPGPGTAFFKAAQKEFGKLPFIAEDLGEINQAVHTLRDTFSLPGMRILQFAFGDNMPSSDYIPHNYIPNCIAYTGTHDNNTTRGWYRKDADKATLKRITDYSGKDVHEKNVHRVLGQLAYASIANTVILPLQDVLGLDESARMNTPASTKNNWQWRFQRGALNSSIEKLLGNWTQLYKR